MAFKTKYPELVGYAKKKYKDLGSIISVYTLQNLWSSPEMAKALGYTQQEMEGMKMSQLIPLSPSAVSRAFMELFFRKEKGGLPTRTKDGKVVYVGGVAGGFIFKSEPYMVAYKMYTRPIEEKDTKEKDDKPWR